MLRCRQRYAIFHATKSDGQGLSTATNTYNCPQTFQPSTPLPPPSTPRSDMLLLSLLEDFSSVLVAFAHYTKSVTWVGESMRLSGDLDIKSSSPIRLLSLLYRYG